MIRTSLVLLAAAAAFSWTGAAQAQDVNHIYYGFGGAFGVNNYTPTDRQIPYFAEHPPVYYSVPVARTYGYSPYAYLPTVMTPDAPAPEPITIENAYIPRSDAPATEDRTTRAPSRPEPLVVLNPYFDGGSLAADEQK